MLLALVGFNLTQYRRQLEVTYLCVFNINFVMKIPFIFVPRMDAHSYPIVTEVALEMGTLPSSFPISGKA